MNSNEANPWITIACYCSELAPISGPLLDCIGQTAAAIQRAGERADLPASILNLISESLLCPEDDKQQNQPL